MLQIWLMGTSQVSCVTLDRSPRPGLRFSHCTEVSGREVPHLTVPRTGSLISKALGDSWVWRKP